MTILTNLTNNVSSRAEQRDRRLSASGDDHQMTLDSIIEIS
ncbi:hypothetical protein MC7420_268 [Coleofasciculus chthonoplastes PCC 7420]|uniref:Uncharacterized protein n=1 Tax=Coleofasciculus chthonoplastes PCC 7420 TaxID=118168 RepID=B4VKR6_9CYAN|nr:hypothetical protein [Coleofasciculus chthonoplastes]EDX77131.1 hypothetical protein MC7420_268 [Coleofasciculus chthonoplastes PCC 7420]